MVIGNGVYYKIERKNDEKWKAYFGFENNYR
jgi:hypothetical protein